MKKFMKILKFKIKLYVLAYKPVVKPHLLKLISSYNIRGSYRLAHFLMIIYFLI